MRKAEGEQLELLDTVILAFSGAVHYVKKTSYQQLPEFAKKINMNTLVKIVLGGLAVFLAVGGPRHFSKPKPPTQTQPREERPAPRPVPISTQPDRQPETRQPVPVDGRPVAPPSDTPATFTGTPGNQIQSLDWLNSNGNRVVEMQEARLTYYLQASSKRTSVDSVALCMREKIRGLAIDEEEFQYTYFLDRVLIAGVGILHWQGNAYQVRYNRLRAAGWDKGSRNFKNSYRCSNFSFQGKNAINFINQNLGNKELFTPLAEVQAPNGLTSSGQEAINWGTVSVNRGDFPMSVPNERRRNSLTTRHARDGYWEPFPRSFMVIITQNNRMFLTEIMDTGSGVKKNWIDWRIGNTSGEIKYFFSLGSKVRAICYTFDDPSITLDQVLANSAPLTRK